MSTRTWRVLRGDAAMRLSNLPAESVNAVVTSPPYFGLRDYRVDGQIGVERTPEAYVSSLVEVFRGVRRVLRDDGTCWLNLGDSYAASGRGGGSSLQHHALGREISEVNGFRMPPHGYKQKDLIGVPWMVAFALRADGWYLRSDIVWSKPNCMPESVTDRPTRSHEYVFLLTKSKHYWYDADAIREPVSQAMLDQIRQGYNGTATKDFASAGAQNASAVKKRIVDKQRGHTRRHAGFNDRWDAMSREEQMAYGANARSVWSISPEPSSIHHFAMMPTALARKCILAGCPAGGTVLDPFTGSGTTGIVALQENRSFVGVELNPEYHALARRRLADAMPLLAREADPVKSFTPPSTDMESFMGCGRTKG